MSFLFAIFLPVVFNPQALTVDLSVAPEIGATTTPQDIWIDKLIQCESNGSTTVKILDTNQKYSTGLLQFQESTWLAYGKKFGATGDNITDGNLQRTVARDMLDNGGWRHWYHCSQKIMKTLGEYPRPSV